MRKIFSLLLLLCAVMSINPALAQTVVFKETFEKCAAVGGYDGAFGDASNGNIDTGKEDDYTDNPGWTIENGNQSKVYPASKCLKFASGDYPGEIISPALGVEGDAAITFEAASWSNKNSTLKLSVVGEGSLDVVEFSLNDNMMDTYIAKLSGATSETKIKFSALKDKQCFLGKITVTQGGEVQATCATPVITAAQTTFSESTTATIETTTAGSTIYYTGSDETEYPGNGTWVQYENELSITESQVLKAIAVCEGMQNSKITELQFTKLENVPSTFLYRKVTSNKDIVNGGVYLIVAENAKKALSSYDSDIYNAVSVVIENGYCTFSGEVNTVDAPYEVTIESIDGTQSYRLKTISGYVEYGGASSTVLSQKEAATTDKYWNIDVDDSKGAVLRSYFKSATSTARCLLYRSGYNFRNYAVTSITTSGYDAPVLYRRIESTEGTFSIRTNEGYGTFYSEKPFIVPEGVKAGIVPGVDDAGVLSVDYKYDAGSTVPAGTALIVKSDADASGTFNFHYTDCDDAAPENRLYGKNGVNAEGMTEVAGADKYYTMNYGDNGLGFYYAEVDGAATAYRDGCAFLALSSSEAAKAISFIFNGGVTGIEKTVLEECGETPTYTLSGVPVSTGGELPKGIYVRNGKKFIVK